MKEENLTSSIEVFICNYKKDNDECCFDKGAKDLTDQLKKWAKEETNKKIKVFRSGCLGKCSEGIALAYFPQKKIVLDIKLDDCEELKKGLNEALQELKV